MPQNVMQAYNCEVYRGYVDHSGHAKYVGVAGKLAESSLADVVEGLRGMGAEDQAYLATQALDWVRANPEQIQQ